MFMRTTSESLVRQVPLQILYTKHKGLFNLNRPYMKDLFQRNLSDYNLRSPSDLSVPSISQKTFGLKSIRYGGAFIWDHLPSNIKNAENIEIFKKLIKTWSDLQCKCAHFKYLNGTADHS